MIHVQSNNIKRMTPRNVLFSEGNLCTLKGKKITFPPKERGEGWTACGEHYEHAHQEGGVSCRTYIIPRFVIQVVFETSESGSTSGENSIWKCSKTKGLTSVENCVDPYGVEWIAGTWELPAEQDEDEDVNEDQEEVEDEDEDERNLREIEAHLDEKEEKEGELELAAAEEAKLLSLTWVLPTPENKALYLAARTADTNAKIEWEKAIACGENEGAVASLHAAFMKAKHHYLEVSKVVYPSSSK
jgi:hypothetical protein